TAPIASKSHALAAAGSVEPASRSAVTENNGPGVRTGTERTDAGTGRDGRLRNESRSISPVPGTPSDRWSLVGASGVIRRCQVAEAPSGSRAGSSTRVGPRLGRI